jgi:hypothetical protein
VLAGRQFRGAQEGKVDRGCICQAATAVDGDSYLAGMVGDAIQVQRSPGVLTGRTGLPSMILVELDEIAERHGKFDVFVGIERIEADRIFEARYDQRETQGVEPGVEQLQIVRQASQFAALFLGNLLELLGDGRS